MTVESSVLNETPMSSFLSSREHHQKEGGQIERAVGLEKFYETPTSEYAMVSVVLHILYLCLPVQR